ncbi:MAG: cytochrome c-type biogenesis protein CcmH [Anaerolineae bacterium]|nr:cytochrome c-type biogenesis protein CcmH [Anaerolineae bacterium]
MNSVKRWFTLAVVLLLLLIKVMSSATLITLAQGDATPVPTLRPVTEAEVNAAAKNLYCPVCENLPLAVCYTDACLDWKQQVRDLLAQGYTQEQIEAYFATRFGPKTVGTPTTPQAQLLTIVLPLALIGLIGVVVLLNLLQWRSRRQHEQEITPDFAEADGSIPIDDEYRARLEAELNQE